ncbi:MAG: hypothetical protein Q8R88_00195 [Desulfoprunum sp.]|nr:hypothetical protein [Desulfoprunum sp.]
MIPRGQAGQVVRKEDQSLLHPAIVSCRVVAKIAEIHRPGERESLIA